MVACCSFSVVCGRRELKGRGEQPLLRISFVVVVPVKENGCRKMEQKGVADEDFSFGVGCSDQIW